MWLVILKWICFLIVCIDTVAYIVSKTDKLNDGTVVVGLLIGIAMRVFVLYGTATCWLLV